MTELLETIEAIGREILRYVTLFAAFIWIWLLLLASILFFRD